MDKAKNRQNEVYPYTVLLWYSNKRTNMDFFPKITQREKILIYGTEHKNPLLF